MASTTVMGGALAWATGGDFLAGAMQGLTIGGLNFAEHDITYNHDAEGNICGTIRDVEIVGRRHAFSGSLLGFAGALNTIGNVAEKNIRMGSNGKYYFRNQNGKVFMGNQYVTTKALKTAPYVKWTGDGLAVISEAPEIMYTYSKYGIQSRELQRALAVSSGRIIGANYGGYYGGMIVGGATASTAAYFSLGTGAVPAYFYGEVVGSIGGGWLGAELGGWIAGYMFDLGF